MCPEKIGMWTRYESQHPMGRRWGERVEEGGTLLSLEPSVPQQLPLPTASILGPHKGTRSQKSHVHLWLGGSLEPLSLEEGIQPCYLSCSETPVFLDRAAFCFPDPPACR